MSARSRDTTAPRRNGSDAPSGVMPKQRECTQALLFVRASGPVSELAVRQAQTKGVSATACIDHPACQSRQTRFHAEFAGQALPLQPELTFCEPRELLGEDRLSTGYGLPRHVTQ